MTNLHVFGTRALLKASEKVQIRRFVHCSSSITIGFGDIVPTTDGSRLFTVIYIWVFFFFIVFPLACLVSEIMIFFVDHLVCIVKEDYVQYDPMLKKRKYHGTKIAILSIAIVAHVVMGIGLTHYFMANNDSMDRYTNMYVCVCMYVCGLYPC